MPTSICQIQFRLDMANWYSNIILRRNSSSYKDIVMEKWKVSPSLIKLCNVNDKQSIILLDPCQLLAITTNIFTNDNQRLQLSRCKLTYRLQCIYAIYRSNLLQTKFKPLAILFPSEKSEVNQSTSKVLNWFCSWNVLTR